MASQETINIVKSTAPVLEVHGEAITKEFYKLLFENNPQLKDMFNMTNQKIGTQPKALANAVFKYATYIDKLEMMGPDVAVIAQKHSSLSVTPEMYPIVGENLLKAIKIVLGDAATPEIMNAWEEAYGDLAAIFIKVEEDIYVENESQEGGFRGQQEFVVDKVIKESELISSFYLKRKDGTPVPNFLPGQYVVITVDIPGTEHKHTRNYSLSDTPNGNSLRISVKREANEINGIVSNYLHQTVKQGDVLNIGIPSGEFVVSESKKPIVLISAGVGITPIFSMFKNLAEQTEREITFIQCALNSSHQAFISEIDSINRDGIKKVRVYDKPTEKDNLGDNFQYQGYLSLDVLSDLNITKDQEFYFCGPTPFMANTLSLLNILGVDENQINYEFFGPVEDLKLQK